MASCRVPDYGAIIENPQKNSFVQIHGPFHIDLPSNLAALKFQCEKRDAYELKHEELNDLIYVSQIVGSILAELSKALEKSPVNYVEVFSKKLGSTLDCMFGQKLFSKGKSLEEICIEIDLKGKNIS